MRVGASYTFSIDTDGSLGWIFSVNSGTISGGNGAAISGCPRSRGSDVARVGSCRGYFDIIIDAVLIIIIIIFITFIIIVIIIIIIIIIIIYIEHQPN